MARKHGLDVEAAAVVGSTGGAIPGLVHAAVGIGANPARSGTPGGGNGGGIYLDGNAMSLDVYDTVINDNVANEGGGAIFFVSNNRTGTMSINDSTLRSNPSLGFETNGFPGIFVLAAAPPTVVNSTIE